MKIDLIDYTGNGHKLPDFAARLLAYTKNTRLEQGPDNFNKFMNMSKEDLAVELDYISKSVRSSWEFVDYTFQIRGVTRAFTHQLVRTRTASYAQQSQRSVDVGDFEYMIPAGMEDLELSIYQRLMRAIQIGYKDMRELGASAQDARGILPTNIHTNIVVKMNLRTLADIIGKRKNLRAQGEYADVAAGFEILVNDVHPWTKQFLNPERLQTPNIDALLKDALGGASPIDKPAINAALKELDALKGTWG